MTSAVRVRSLDIPVLSGFANPHRGETPETMRLVAHVRSSLGRHLPELKILSLIGDAGFDAADFYRFANDIGADPIVALGATPLPSPESGDIHPDGRPLCVGGAPMKLQSRQDGALVYNCPALNYRRVSGGGHEYQFDAARCPLGARCVETASGPFRRVVPNDHPRLLLPVLRDSDEFKRRMNERTATERNFSHQHNMIPDRAYRRLHLWQFACAMHTLLRQAEAVRAAGKAYLESFWEAIRPATAATAA